MAHLNTESFARRGGWKWLASLLLVVALPLFMISCETDDRQTTTDPVIDDTYDDGTITSVAMLTDVMDPERLEGRDVELFNVRVVEVLGDSAFYVTQGMGTTPGAATPGATAPGQTDPGTGTAAPGTTEPGTTTPGTGATPGTTTPGTTGQGMGTEDRVLVVYDAGILGGITGDDMREHVQVGRMVDVHGTVRTIDDLDWAGTRPGTQPTGTQQTGTQQPGVTGTAMMDQQVYVEARSVDRHDPARTGTGVGTGTRYRHHRYWRCRHAHG